MPKMWERWTEGGMHRVSVACARIGTDMYELCSCYAPGLLEGKENGCLSKWVRVQVSFPCIRQRLDQNRTITISLGADVYVTVLDVYQLCTQRRKESGEPVAPDMTKSLPPWT